MLPFKIGHYHMMGGCQMHRFSLSLCYSSSDAFYKCSNSRWRLLSQIHPKFILVLGWLNQNQWGRFHLCKSKMVTGDSLWIGVLDLLGQLNHQVLLHFLPVSNWTPKPRFVPNISHCRKSFKLNYFLYVVVVLHHCLCRGPYILRTQCQQLLELLQLQQWPIRCLDQRRIDIWRSFWYVSA